MAICIIVAKIVVWSGIVVFTAIYGTEQIRYNIELLSQLVNEVTPVIIEEALVSEEGRPFIVTTEILRSSAFTELSLPQQRAFLLQTVEQMQTYVSTRGCTLTEQQLSNINKLINLYSGLAEDIGDRLIKVANIQKNK
uniref:Uncharacterized protein n=1 Tax=Cavenderia fasciculata TaxID=261658 RepID=B2XX81_CACFS|nr:hypothetical protein Difao_mp19 [Cavenderia fasciculata]ABX45203.1 hypothetical protein [Cavenderia fasciculata]